MTSYKGSAITAEQRCREDAVNRCVMLAVDLREAIAAAEALIEPAEDWEFPRRIIDALLGGRCHRCYRKREGVCYCESDE